MTFGTWVVLAVVAGCVALAIRSMIRDKKAGKSLQCGGNCAKCHGACAGLSDEQLKQMAQEAARREAAAKRAG